jgi:hypothetical protein
LEAMILKEDRKLLDIEGIFFEGLGYFSTML